MAKVTSFDAHLAARGHLRPTICVRKHPSQTFESRAFASGSKLSRRLVKILMNVRTQLSGRRCPGRKCPRRKFPDANIRVQMSGLKYSDGKVRDANFRTQVTPRHNNYSRVSKLRQESKLTLIVSNDHLFDSYNH